MLRVLECVRACVRALRACAETSFWLHSLLQSRSWCCSRKERSVTRGVSVHGARRGGRGGGHSGYRQPLGGLPAPGAHGDHHHIRRHHLPPNRHTCAAREGGARWKLPAARSASWQCSRVLGGGNRPAAGQGACRGLGFRVCSESPGRRPRATGLSSGAVPDEGHT